jgi:hypothetical protein
VGVFLALYHYAPLLFGFIAKIDHHWYSILFGTVAILIVAVALFMLKESPHAIYYALLELAFATATALFTLGPIHNPNSSLLTTCISIGGCIYLVVRGCDNYAKAKEKKRRRGQKNISV